MCHNNTPSRRSGCRGFLRDGLVRPQRRDRQLDDFIRFDAGNRHMVN